MYVRMCIKIIYTLMLTVFQSNEHWDSTAKVHPELEPLYKEYKATTKGTYVF